MKSIKNSFAGGELSTDLDGRTDLAKYATGAQLLENFYVTRFGGVSNRQGTDYITPSLRTSSASSRTARLIPFQFSVTQAYMLEFTNNIMRVIKDGAIVLTSRRSASYTWTASGSGTDEWYLRTAASGDPFTGNDGVNECWENGTLMTEGTVGALASGEWAFGDNDSLGYTTLYVRLTATGDPDSQAAGWVQTDYQLNTGLVEGRLADMRYAQSADTLFIAQKDTQPAKITRTADDAWTYTALTYAPTSTTPIDFYYTKAGFTTTDRQVRYAVAALDSLNRESLPTSDLVVGIDLNWADATDRVDLFWNNITDGTESTPVFQWTQVGATAEYYLELNGGGDPSISEPNAVYEDKVAMTLGTVTSLSAGQYWYGDNGAGFNTIYVRITGDVDPDTKANGYITYTLSTDVQWRVYKNYRGDWGWVGDVDKPWFLDDNVEPDVSTAPKSNTDYFNTGDADDYPGAIALYEQRLIYARSDNNPQRVWASTVGDFLNFANSRPLRADDTVIVTLDSGGRMDEIKHLTTLRDALMVFTSGSEWSVDSGSNGDTITPYTIAFKNEGYEGVSDTIEPIGIGNKALFVQRDNKQIMGLGFNLDDGGYPSAQLNLLAQHLFEENTIVDWCYQQHPYNLIWLVMADGTMVSMTYLPSQELIAFTRHTTDGYYRACGSIINGTTNDVYFIVERIINGTTKNFIEQLSSREFGDNVRDAKFLDCADTYTESGTITNVQVTPFSTVVTSASHGLSAGDFVLIDGVGGITSTGSNEEYSQFNDRYYKVASPAANSFEIQDLAGSPLTSTDFTGTYIANTITGDTPTFYKCAKTVSGLDHLEGATVTALCDGNVVSGLTVSSGSVTVDSETTTPGFGVIHVGLPYNCNLQTLRFELATGQQTIQHNKKNIKSLVMRFKDSVGGYAGPDADNLTEIKWRQNEEWTVPNALKTEDVEHKIASTWDREGRIYFRQSDPLPTTILAVIMEYNLGDK